MKPERELKRHPKPREPRVEQVWELAAAQQFWKAYELTMEKQLRGAGLRALGKWVDE